MAAVEHFSDQITNFRPHPLIRGGHLQTLAGLYLPHRLAPYSAEAHELTLSDGDTIILHDDCPPQWTPGDKVVLLMHGLAGCHQSPYMVRIASKLNQLGVRTFRMDLRGCGAGEGLARYPYHAGRSDDALQAIYSIVVRCPHSPICAVGFSLSGNIVLKLLGESGSSLPSVFRGAVAVNPPIDLLECVKGLAGIPNSAYDRHFVALLTEHLRDQMQSHPDIQIDLTKRPIRCLLDFDDVYTAPASGFADAYEYYAQSSAQQFIPNITSPTLLLTAKDDPLVPVAPFLKLQTNKHVTLHISNHGGHLGYVGRRGDDPDRRWMDWRVVEWLMQL